jgi:hypothetical protein
MPFLHKHRAMLAYHIDYATNFMRAKAPAFGDLYWLQPDLDRSIAFVDMNMGRLIRL